MHLSYTDDLSYCDRLSLEFKFKVTPVHNDVDPQQLQHIERFMPTNDGSHKGCHQGDEVHRQLELEELADIVEDRAAPQYRFYY